MTIAKHLAINFVAELLIQRFRAVAFDRDTEAIRIHVIDDDIVVLAEDPHDVGALALVAINPIIFHDFSFWLLVPGITLFKMGSADRLSAT